MTNKIDDTIRLDLRLDRQTFEFLRALADRRGAGVCGVIRHELKNAIDRSRHAKCADRVTI